MHGIMIDFLLPVSPDFQLLNETFVFDADSNSTQCVFFQTSEDDIVEGDDTLNVTTLTSPTDQAVNIVADPILVTILNDDSKMISGITDGKLLDVVMGKLEQ